MIHDVTARLRPRTGWESQDLGLAMVRGLMGRMMAQWLCVIVPLWAVLAALLWSSPGWLLAVVWWLKPVYDRIPLHTLGRRLFGQETSLRTILRAAPGLLLRGNLYFLTLARLAPHRAIAMPVKFLEGGTFSAYRRRVQTLLHQGDSTITWVTFAWFITSLLCALGLHLILKSVIIDNSDSDSRSWMLEFFSSRSTPWTPSLLRYSAFLYMVSITLTEMFYVGSGFGMYLNSRSHLEGWDIEVTFRGLAGRLQQHLGVIVAGLMLATLTATSALAEVDTSPDHITDALKEIKAHPDFTVHSQEYTVYDDVVSPSGDSSSSDPWDLSWLTGLGDLAGVIRLILISLLIAAAIWLLFRYRHLFYGKKAGPKPPEPEKARVVMGLDVSPETLPDDIPAAAWAAWQQGQIHAAMRLLYAGSLNWMMHRGGLPIRESDTEGDCLRHASLLNDGGKTRYFQSLTQTWIRHTYGATVPAGAEMEQLVRHWPFQK